MLEKRIAELKSRIGEGGLREAAFAACSMSDRRAEWSTSAASRRCARFGATTPDARLTLPEFKMLVREQFFMLLLDQEAALAAIPKLLPDRCRSTSRGLRCDARGVVRQRRNHR